MKKIIIIILFLILLPLSVFSQVQGRARIKGVVNDEETGEPISGVTVKLYNVQAAAFFQPSPVTDKDGKWSVYYIRTGRWELEFEKPGYQTRKVSYDVVFSSEAKPGTKEELLMVTMTKIKGLVIQETAVEGMNKGNKLFNQQKYKEARAVFESILTENPNVYIVNKNIGNCYFALEDYDKAIEYYLKVYEKNPTLSDVIQAIANAYNNKGDQATAAEWYQKVKAEDIQDVTTAFNSGVCLFNSGNPDKAVAYFKKAVEIDKTFADGYYQLGMALVATNNTNEAIEALNKFLELAPNSPQAPVAKSVLEVLVKK